MVAKIALVAAAVLVVTPAAVTVMLPERIDSGSATRSVELSDPILAFNQMGDRIQIRLRPAATEAERNSRRQVTVRTSEGDAMSIPLKVGQTWASAELTGELASADALVINVD